MKKLKKFVALLTAATFMTSFAAPAVFAADAATTAATAAKVIVGKDVKGTKFATPAAKLIALNIIKGYEDGTIKPDSTITRAEFAAIVAKELKLGDSTPSATKFKDVNASHWASGVINLAVGKGIIAGYPDNTFKPEAPVTYAEACAMLVQTIGYGPTLKGASWPAGVLAAAGSSGISKGVSLSANANAPRGSVITMAANTLDADIMEQDTWGPNPEWKKKEGKTILSESFDITVLDKDDSSSDPADDAMPTVSDVSRFDLGTLDADEVKFDGGSSLLGSSKYTVVGTNIDANALIGQQVEVWADTDAKEVLWMGVSNKQEVVSDKIDSYELDGSGNIYKIKLNDSGKKYKVADEVNVYYNLDGQTAFDLNTLSAAELGKLTNASARIILDDKDVITGLVFDDFYGVCDGLTDGSVVAGLVKEVKGDKIEYYNSSSTDSLDVEDDDYVIVKDGVVATLADVKANDVINAFVNVDEDKEYIFVTSAQVKGKVEKVVTGEVDNIAKYDITIGGKKYDSADVVTFSEDNNKSIDEASGSDLSDFDGQDVTAYLDAQGNIKHVSTGKIADSGKLYAVVTKEAKYSAFDDVVKFTAVNKAGSVIDFSFDPSDVDLNDVEKTGAQWVTAIDLDNVVTAPSNVLVIEYKLDSAGKVTKVWDRTSDFETLSADPDDIADTFGDYDVDNDSVIYDMTGTFNAGTPDGAEYKDVKTTKWENVEGKDSVDAIVKIDDDHLDYMLVLDCDGSLGSSAKYGVVTGFATKGGDDALEILNTNGDKEVVVYDGADIAGYTYSRTAASGVDVKKGDFIRYELNTDSEIDEMQVLAHNADITDTDQFDAAALDALNLDYAKTMKVTDETSRSVTGDVVDMEGNATGDSARVSINDKTVIFDIHDTGKLKKVSSVSDDDVIVAVDSDDDGGVADFVVIIN